MDQAADAGDDEEHHHAQRIELEAEVHVQTANGEPVDGCFTAVMNSVGVDEQAGQHEARRDGADGNEAADGFAPQCKKRYHRH
jgi:hypothetical protein